MTLFSQKAAGSVQDHLQLTLRNQSFEGITQGDSGFLSADIHHEGDAVVISLGHLLRRKGSVVQEPKTQVPACQQRGKLAEINGHEALGKIALKFIENDFQM
ncbi:MAG TPA: hypothetical protein VGE29_18655, partial [Prosthecobacter sp.]